MNNVDISVIMLTYNRKKFLPRIIDSVLKQKDCNFEFIIIDNGSDDGSYELCYEYAKVDNRIKLIRKEKGNIGSGRNVGIDNSNGKYITFVDDDDRMDDDMLNYLYSNIKSVDADISICGCYSDFGDRLEVYYVFDEIFILDKHQGVEELLKRKKYNSANPCKLFRRELFTDVRYLNEGKYDDIHTIYKLFANSNKTIVSGVPKYYFTKHQKNNSGFLINDGLTCDQLNEYIDAFTYREEYLKKKLPSISEYATVSKLSYMISMVEKIEVNNIEECYEIKNNIKKIVDDNIDIFKKSDYLSERDRYLISRYYVEKEKI